jgi:hypothetical protein
MSLYVELLELRKAALQQEDEKLAQELWDQAQALLDAGLVTEDELTAAAYV